MGEGRSAYGTTFEWNDEPIAELTSIGGPRISVDPIDVSSHSSGVAAFREFVAGMGDAGEVTLEGNLYPGDTPGQKAFADDMIARTKREMIITFPDGTTFTCDAVATGFEPSAPFDDRLSFSATVKLSGVPAFGVTYANNLSALTIATATLYPTFAGGTYVYTATTTGTSVTVTPTCAAGCDKIEVWANGVLISTLDSGGTSSAISAGVAGTNTPIQLRVKKAGKTSRIYNITLVKTA